MDGDSLTREFNVKVITSAKRDTSDKGCMTDAENNIVRDNLTLTNTDDSETEPAMVNGSESLSPMINTENISPIPASLSHSTQNSYSAKSLPGGTPISARLRKQSAITRWKRNFNSRTPTCGNTYRRKNCFMRRRQTSEPKDQISSQQLEETSSLQAHGKKNNNIFSILIDSEESLNDPEQIAANFSFSTDGKIRCLIQNCDVVIPHNTAKHYKEHLIKIHKIRKPLTPLVTCFCNLAHTYTYVNFKTHKTRKHQKLPANTNNTDIDAEEFEIMGMETLSETVDGNATASELQ